MLNVNSKLIELHIDLLLVLPFEQRVNEGSTRQREEGARLRVFVFEDPFGVLAFVHHYRRDPVVGGHLPPVDLDQSHNKTIRSRSLKITTN